MQAQSQRFRPAMGRHYVTKVKPQERDYCARGLAPVQAGMAAEVGRFTGTPWRHYADDRQP